MSENIQKRLSHVDLNLLPVLSVLIETESTQATADRIGRTQSAVSHALNRLREVLEDPLFVRHGPRLIPTPLLKDLKAPLNRLLIETTLLLERGHQFDPKQSDRLVVIGCPDLAMPLAGQICDTLSGLAPDMRFRIASSRDGNKRLLQGELDLLISLYRNDIEPGLMLHDIGTVDWAYFATLGASPASDPPTVNDWIKLPHVQVHTGPSGRSPVEDAARIAGIKRRVGLQVEGFMEAVFIASLGHYIFTSFPKLIGPLAKKLGLAVYSLPFSVPPAPITLITRTTRFDPLSDWLSRLAVEVAGDLLSGGTISGGNKISEAYA